MSENFTSASLVSVRFLAEHVMDMIRDTPICVFGAFVNADTKDASMIIWNGRGKGVNRETSDNMFVTITAAYVRMLIRSGLTPEDIAKKLAESLEFAASEELQTYLEEKDVSDAAAD